MDQQEPTTPAVLFRGADPPRRAHLVACGDATALVGGLGEPCRQPVVVGQPEQLRVAVVAARSVPLRDALPLLLAGGTPTDTDAAWQFWQAVAVAAVQLVARGRLLPGLTPGDHAAWRSGPLDASDLAHLRTLAAAMPIEARAIPVDHAGLSVTTASVATTPPVLVPTAEPLVRAFVDAVADLLPRSPAAPLASDAPEYAATEPTAAPHLRDWADEVATGVDAGVRVSLRLEIDDAASGAFLAVVQAHSLADPTLVTDVRELGVHGGPGFGPRARVDAMVAVRRAARVWPPLARLLTQAVPTEVSLSDQEVEELLDHAAVTLSAAGVDVHWPKELARTLTAHATVQATNAPPSQLQASLTADSLLDFRWQVAMGGADLTEAEMSQLAEAQRPVVRLRDQWVLVDPALSRKVRERALKPVTAIDALGLALTGTAELDGQAVPVRTTGWLDRLRERIATPDAGDEDVAQPEQLAATLRDYQLQGLRWLHRMTSLGLGGCLADDMGLGKTITVIALHLRRQRDPATAGPTLVVCPASLLGNWEHEVERFAPGTPVRRFHGAGRSVDDAAEGFVLTTYGTMRRDQGELARTRWPLLVADEAQHVKNPYSGTAKALRTIEADARVALTGTPVENNLSELWAILDWTTPGLLGSLTSFRLRWAKAIESDRDAQASAHLAKLVRPFLLRRRKSDPGIAPELPQKTETDQQVSLSREQATLYEAVVRETLADIRASTGMARRGLVLKLLTALKQICNHPAQYLGDTAGRLSGRSGKLELLDELVDTILAEDGAVLVFTQYVAMARLLDRHLTARGVATQLLHGGTPVKRREEMVRRFQAAEAPVFLLSLKAAGTGLNLTRADHVVHYDRWWNPAVEEQATDRAYRIGQTKSVQVHRLVTEGTVEERITKALAAKRELAEAVLSGGEAALTELSDAELAELVELSRSPTSGGGR